MVRWAAAAATVLRRDASLISRRVSALEARLGVRLLARTTRRVAVTEAGAAYLRRVQAILAELAAADAEAADRAAAPRGVLCLAVPAAFGRMWVAPLLPGFLAAYPAIRIELRHADRYVDLVAEGFDAAIRVGALQDSGLVARRLASFRRLLCASPAYLSAHGTPATPEALEHHACLGLDGTACGRTGRCGGALSGRRCVQAVRWCRTTARRWRSPASAVPASCSPPTG